MIILVTGANGQLGNLMRIISKDLVDSYIFTDVNKIEGLETIYLNITDLDAIRKMVVDNNVQAIVNCAAGLMLMMLKNPKNMLLWRKSIHQLPKI